MTGPTCEIKQTNGGVTGVKFREPTHNANFGPLFAAVFCVLRPDPPMILPQPATAPNFYPH